MDACNLQEFFVQVASKKKSEADVAKEALAAVSADNAMTNDVLDVVLASLKFNQKPATIAAACDFVARFAAAQDLQQSYYLLIPAVSPFCLDVKKQVKDSSRACLNAMYAAVNNKDLAELIPELIKTINDPKLTDDTITKVAATKFVTTVTAGTVAILCPLLLRGYALRKDKQSRLCSKIIVNMLQLVEDFADVENFLPVLTPAVQSAIEVVNDPEARSTITECLKKLNEMEKMKDSGALESSSAPEGATELCNCQFTLAYGSKILLKNTNMTLYKGYKYGLIGEGGKTTLLSAISENKVDNFPDASEVKCVFVQTDIVGEKSHLNCVDYVLDDDKIKALNFTEEQVVKALLDFEFGNESVNPNSPAQVNHGVSTLSGGWRMKLALARAMLIDPDILLLESPTDHLDVVNIAWIQNYIKDCNKTVIFTSQSKETLTECCTHIAQIKKLKLTTFHGNLEALIAKDPDVEEYFKMDKVKENAVKFTFPAPGALEGVKSRSRAIVKMQNCTFTYPGNTVPTIEDVTFQVSLVSRVGVCGKNGEGKSTAIKLLTGENIPQEGSVYKHPSVRLGYLAQHSFDTINNHPEKTANEYIRWRFEIPGEDREAIKKKTTTLTEEEEQELFKTYKFQFKNPESEMVTVSGVVKGLTGLRKKEKDGSSWYQVEWVGKGQDANCYIPLAELEKVNKIVFGKLIKAVDEKIAAMAGLFIRPLTQGHVEQHLADIGLEPELGTHTKLSQLSDGEKVKAVLGACMWMNPHIIVFDEPTNSLSWDSLVALVAAIKDFKGGVVVISHNQAFIDEVCNEIWLMRKDPKSGIAHLSITGGDTTDMKDIFEEASKEDTYIDGAGNVQKLKQKFTDGELKKKIKEIQKKLKENEKKKTLSDDDRWALEDELLEHQTDLEKLKAIN